MLRLELPGSRPRRSPERRCVDVGCCERRCFRGIIVELKAIVQKGAETLATNMITLLLLLCNIVLTRTQTSLL